MSENASENVQILPNWVEVGPVLLDALEWEHCLLIAQRDRGERVVNLTMRHETRSAIQIMANARAAIRKATGAAP